METSLALIMTIWVVVFLFITVVEVDCYAPVGFHYDRATFNYAASTDAHNEIQSHDQTNDDENEGTDSSSMSSSSSCPFSTTIPRYRIDLSTGKRTKDKRNSISKRSFLGLPSIPWQSLFQRNRLENLKLREGESLTIHDDVDGIEAMACLWRDVADIIIQASSTLPSKTSVIALPGAPAELVVNFVEIVDWMSTNAIDDRSVKVNVQLIQQENSDADLPVIRLTTIIPPVLTKLSPLRYAMDNQTKNDNIFNERTRHWVRRLLVDEKICPFTRSDKMSGQGLADLGVPVGSIAYRSSDARHPAILFADTWTAIDQMIQAGPEGRDGVSSILLAAPSYDDDFQIWAGPIFAMLEASVVAAGAEKEIGVVCFHPKYATPDGSTFPGFGHMHSVPRLAKWCKEYWNDQASQKTLSTDEVAAGGAWQRRTPHATINVLRADQLAVAESRRESDILYPKNIERLIVDIGSDQLAFDLDRERQMGTN
jgi:hypothetical protein